MNSSRRQIFRAIGGFLGAVTFGLVARQKEAAPTESTAVFQYDDRRARKAVPAVPSAYDVGPIRPMSRTIFTYTYDSRRGISTLNEAS